MGLLQQSIFFLLSVMLVKYHNKDISIATSVEDSSAYNFNVELFSFNRRLSASMYLVTY